MFAPSLARVFALIKWNLFTSYKDLYVVAIAIIWPQTAAVARCYAQSVVAVCCGNSCRTIARNRSNLLCMSYVRLSAHVCLFSNRAAWKCILVLFASFAVVLYNDPIKLFTKIVVVIVLHCICCVLFEKVWGPSGSLGRLLNMQTPDTKLKWTTFDFFFVLSGT